MERVEGLHGAGELDAWFRGTVLRSRSSTLAVVEVPTALHGERVLARLALLKETLEVTEVKVRVSEMDLETALFGHNFANTAELPPLDVMPAPAAPTTPPTGPRAPDLLPIHPDYTFDRFVTGPCNRVAHAASMAVSERPATVFNPLFLHGAVGLGKTHLMHAIAHSIRLSQPTARILCLSCEQFTNHYVHAIRQGAFDSFRNFYRDADVLIVDDVQLLANKQRTQEEFFHTFNALYALQKQIVLSSDAPPAEIPSLQERLVSRFKWGLEVHIDKPCFETRVVILQQKAARLGIVLPDPVVQYLADRVQDSVRSLEGSLINLKAHAALDGQPISLRLAQRALQATASPQQREVRVSEILDAVVEHFGARIEDIRSKKRSQSIVLPRQVAMYISRKLTSLSLEEVGAHFGGRDHSTVIYAVQKISDRLRVDGDFARRLQEIERLARGGRPR
ncbi:MAG: chromosomal replication initiator protein DnaA [Planctomycetota bacterium]|nr:chromosomal replication initiator protein DnaA [Planctomycetota bacterium]